MMKRLASDLSPAQVLLSQITCSKCQAFAIESHFKQAIHLVEKVFSEDSWQRKRLFALLNPMYPEIQNGRLSIGNDLSFLKEVRINELLLEYKESRLERYPACTHQDALQADSKIMSQALERLKKIFNEVLGEQVF